MSMKTYVDFRRFFSEMKTGDRRARLFVREKLRGFVIIDAMQYSSALTFVLLLSFVLIYTGCSKGDAVTSNTAVTSATPGKAFKPADLAKLKWIEGDWRGMDGDKPFFERYRFESDSVMLVETFTDETFSKIEDTSRFELKDGEFGHSEGDRRSAASSITENAVQFVPVGKGNRYRFERQADGSWDAVLEWPADANKPTQKKIYKMQPVR